MKSTEIRQKFIDFFKSKGHTVVASSPLVPGNDPTLLFTNSGMVQFKDVFLGTEKRSYVRAVSVQRCLRAGGKHNDLENVGYTARHHTFFEMLGNWSFGNYFKRDALIWAWELLTTAYGLPADKLWATVYETDDEAYDIWVNVIGLPKERVVRIGDNKGTPYASDNFWQMADTGPCGPCSEIFYDHGPEVQGGPPGSPDAEGDRYIEIWNIVFMQFDRQIDAKTGIATLTPLPKPCVDTGMGLERLAAVQQHVHSNYDIDLFQGLIKAAGRETGAKDLTSPSLKVIADHIRACAFLIVDGVIPDNEGRGYVLRRIARRAMRHGNKLGQKQPFFYRLVDDLVREMGDAYPELREAKGRVTATLKQEEERFGETLENGMRLLDAEVSIKNFALRWLERERGWIYKYRGFSSTDGMGPSYDALFSVNDEEVPVQVISTKVFDSSATNELYGLAEWLTNEPLRQFKKMVLLVITSEEGKEIPQQVQSIVTASSFPIEPVTVDEDALKPFRKLRGEAAFKLYDTYGFPIDLIADIGRERGFEIDLAGFEAAMAAQQERSRAASKFTTKGQLEYSGAATVFGGYETLQSEAKVLALYREGAAVPVLKAGESGVVVLDRTPFYAESGGQVGDRGALRMGRAVFEVSDTQKIQADVFGHHGKLAAGTLEIGQMVIAEVDAGLRARTMRHHSVTHLMHKALRQVLGHHVQQKGSLVDPDKTRFDFSHNAPMTAEEIREVEELVNAEILANAATQARVMKFDDAVKHGAMALFGEKYGDEVRVLDIGSSRELCGGTHVARTGDIGLFKIVSEGGVAAGVRRVEGIAGSVALHYVQTLDRRLYAAAELLKVHPAEIDGRIAQMLDNVRALEKELARLKSKLAASQGDDLVDQAVDVKGVKVLAAKLDGADAQALRETMDKLKDKLKSAVILLSAVSDGKVALVAGVTADLTGKVKAGELVNFVAQQVGGKGGGRPDMAQAGGTNPAALPQALAAVKEWVEAKL
jgi:alanyl-tRNA synthetase